MTFHDFAIKLEKLESTASRLAMTELLAQLYGQLNQDELKIASYLMKGRLVPEYESLEFNLSVKLVIRVLARLSAGRSQAAITHTAANLFGQADYSQLEKQVTSLYKRLGDLGLVAQDVIGKHSTSQRSHRLTISQVYDQLVKIAQDSGQGSQDRKVLGLAELLGQVDQLSARYITRMVIGKLRLGFSTMTMLDALSWAVTGNKSESKILEEALQKRADVGELTVEYLKLKTLSTSKRAESLKKIKVKVGVPVGPALCQRLNSADEIIAKMGEVIVEPKYDGLRLQLHLNKSAHQLRAFTRNLDNVSHMFPELEAVSYKLKCQSCILDGEVIGMDPLSKKLVSFQRTVTRKRKHDVAAKAQELPIKFYVFDLLELNGRSLIDQKLRTRKELLKKLFTNREHLEHTPFIITKDPSELRSFHEAQLGEGLEGAVIKQPNSFYTSGRKGWHWVKIKEKQDTTGKLNDTLDCIVMGYYFGRGKRTEFGLGAILVGLVDDRHKQELQLLTIAKIGTGLSDQQLQQIKAECDQLKVKTQPHSYQVHKNLFPDIWIKPHLVVEVAADEITNSPVHSAGLALRFPRLIKIRADKSPEQATTISELKQIQVA